MEHIAFPIALLALGLIAFFLEVFIPSGGAISVVALCCVFGAIVLAYAHHGGAVGTLFVILSIVLVPVCLISALTMLPKTRFGRRLTLRTSQKADEGYVAQSSEEDKLLGETGEALSMLRPSGEARIAGRRYDVMTEGEMIQKGAAIEVRRVEGNRIVVREVKEKPEEA